jgi:CrcB protein
VGLEKALLIGLGGVIGALSRFAVYDISRSWWTHGFPLPTLIINGLGCLMGGMFFEYWREHPWFPTLSLFFAVGFLGSFTTFSTFGLESFQLMRQGEYTLAVVNVGANTLLGLLAVAVGVWLGGLLR